MPRATPVAFFLFKIVAEMQEKRYICKKYMYSIDESINPKL